MKKTRFVVNEPVFKTGTIFLCGYSHIELGKELKRQGVVDFDEQVKYYESSNGACFFFESKETKSGNAFRVIWTRHFDKSADTIGTAVHEITHLVFRICEWKGIPLTSKDNADETFAYLADFYTRHFISNLYGKKFE